ncbi:hypothetical protein NQ318_019071 [Aromia moschata]|uniref:DUF4817 domain-containing protein n=1 Tax=Aromia moschata TaxID=1265417 RepID=A0AAV8Y681_9CUCU|nr:hypothetical protein NQ318_019071 [Aromia moschata]
MLECFIQNGYNSEAASEAYFNRYPERRQPNMSIFGILKENLVEYGGFNKPRPKNYRIQDAEDVAINVVGMVVVNPSISSRQIEAESGISRRRALSVLKKHKFRPYAIRKQQQLLPTDPERRLDFCNWYLQQIEQDQLFFKNIIWTDESYVSSAGIFNRHNKHYWSEDNPHQTVDVQNQGRFGFSHVRSTLGQLTPREARCFSASVSQSRLRNSEGMPPGSWATIFIAAAHCENPDSPGTGWIVKCISVPS